MRSKSRLAFTLIELLTVIAVIGLLTGFLMVAITAAREKGRRTRAKAETRELASAWRAYWMLYGDSLGWPVGYAASNVVMNGEAMAILLGDDGDWNPQGIVFIDAPSDAIDRGFRDPWNQPYTVDFSSKSIKGREFYETTVMMPLQDRYRTE